MPIDQSRVEARTSRFLPTRDPLALRRAAFTGASLVAYANGLDSYALARGWEDLGAFRTGLNVVGNAALIAWARRAGLRWEELGFHRRGNGRALSLGVLTGLLLAIPPLVVFQLPHVPGGQVHYTPLHQITRAVFLRRVFLHMLLGVAIGEEIAFRGVLQGWLQRALPPRWALVAGSLAFTLWHIAVTINTVQRTSLPQRWYWLLPSLLGGLAAVFVGGLVFGLLRYYTGNLVSVFAAHWTVDALMMLALYRRARTTFPIAAS